MSLLGKLTATYGSCAMLPRDGDSVVGCLRFCPKAIASMAEAGTLCMRPAYPAGPSDWLVELRFPSLEEIDDRALAVRYLMTGSPQRQASLHQRKGIGTRLVRGLEEWAREKGWRAVVAIA